MHIKDKYVVVAHKSVKGYKVISSQFVVHHPGTVVHKVQAWRHLPLEICMYLMQMDMIKILFFKEEDLIKNAYIFLKWKLKSLSSITTNFVFCLK